MYQESLRDNWEFVKNEIRSNWGELSEEDLNTINGNIEGLVHTLQVRYSWRPDQARREVARFFDRVEQGHEL